MSITSVPEAPSSSTGSVTEAVVNGLVGATLTEFPPGNFTWLFELDSDTVVPEIRREPDPDGFFSRKASDVHVPDVFEQMLATMPPDQSGGLMQLLDAKTHVTGEVWVGLLMPPGMNSLRSIAAGTGGAS